VVLIGAGATLTIDLWGMLLQRTLRIGSLNFCLLGRWVCHMPGGPFRHQSIVAATPKRFECPIGWMAHYGIGIGLAAGFIGLAPAEWLARPALGPALLYGLGTVVFPLFVMQPAFGLGLAGSRSASPWVTRLKSLSTHAVFGTGLYGWALAAGYLLPSCV